LGKPQGVGISEWETDGEQMGRDGDEGISLRATWDQGGRILSQQGGFQVSKGAKKGEQKGNQQGESATCSLSLNVYIMIARKCWNDRQYTYVNNNARYEGC
jgi:hypothetical protein